MPLPYSYFQNTPRIFPYFIREEFFKKFFISKNNFYIHYGGIFKT